MNKRIENEKKFKEWKENKNGERNYKMKFKGKFGWYAEYEKIVDKDENTLSFTQYIYDENNNLKEIHKKYAVDTGHKKI